MADTAKQQTAPVVVEPPSNWDDMTDAEQKAWTESFLAEVLAPKR